MPRSPSHGDLLGVGAERTGSSTGPPIPPLEAALAEQCRDGVGFVERRDLDAYVMALTRPWLEIDRGGMAAGCKPRHHVGSVVGDLFPDRRARRGGGDRDV